MHYLIDERQRLLDKGDSMKTVGMHTYFLKGFFDVFEGRDLKSLSRTEIEQYISAVDATDYSDFTKRNIRHAIKTFYRYLISESFSKFIRCGELYGDMTGKKLLTIEEVQIMIAEALTLRDKAIIALLWSCGLRREELLGLRLKDIDFSHEHIRLSVMGKTGRRTVPVLWGQEHLIAYLGAQPRFSPNSGLWVHGKGLLKETGLREILRRVARRSGIQKRVYPYLFRHSRLTELGKILTEPMLCDFAGWKLGSKMVRVYVHTRIEDLERALVMVERVP